MAKVNWKQASGSLGVANMRKANPTIIGNTRGITNIQNNSINPNVTAIQGTDAYVPRILKNPVPEAVANTANTLVTEAIKYNDRVDQMTADQAVLDYKAASRALFYGKKNDDGTMSEGYKDTMMDKAMAHHNPYSASIDKLTEDYLGGQSESVKSKMILRVQQERSAAKERGVAHNNQQTTLYENNIRFQEKQDILKDIELNGPMSFTNGTIDAHLAKYDTAEEREAASKYLAREAMYMTYNDSQEAASQNTNDLTPAVTAFETTAKAFEAIRGTLSEETENYLQNWLKGKQGVAETQAKANLKMYEDRRKTEIAEDAPRHISESLASGNVSFLDAGIAGFRSTFKNPETASNKIVGTTKDAFKLVVDSAGGVTIADKKALSSSLYDVMLEDSQSFSPTEKMALREYAYVTLPGQMEAQQKNADRSALAERDLLIQESLRDGVKRQFNPNPPPEMTAEYKEKWYAQTQGYKDDWSRGPISGKTRVEADNFMLIARERLQAGETLTNSEMDKIVTYTTEQVYPPGTLAAVQKENNKNKKPTNKKPAYQEEQGYKTTKQRVTNSAHRLVGLPPTKVKESASDEDRIAYAEANAQYKADVSTEKAKAILDLNEKRLDAVKRNSPFDYALWWKDYTKEVLNGGNIITPEESTSYKSDLLYWFTGNPDHLETVMEE